ncbi:MAG: HD domain-containing protein [Kosmotoga sp.]|nr:MAG: HD domain-containing protein [Kosmotoga sp.]
MNNEQSYSLLKDLLREIVSKERLQHIMGTTELAESLSMVYKTNGNYVKMASLGHDLFRDIDPVRLLLMFRGYGKRENEFEQKKPVLLHGKVAALYLKRQFDVQEAVFDAIYWHVSGHKKLNRIGKILMIADIAEENRTFPISHDIRKMAFENLNRAYEMTIRSKIEWALKENTFLLPEIVETWNHIQGGA